MFISGRIKPVTVLLPGQVVVPLWEKSDKFKISEERRYSCVYQAQLDG